MLTDCHFHPLDMENSEVKSGTFRGAGASSHPRQWRGLREWCAERGCPLVLGLHPWAVQRDSSVNENLLAELRMFLRDESCRPAAVGEIGLDKLRADNNYQEQIKVFRRQAEWARELGLPVVLHCVKAFADTTAVLKESFCLHNERAAEGRAGLVHGFWGAAEVCRSWQNLGFCISINPKYILKACAASGRAKNPWRDKLAAIAAVLPLERLLLESDAPWGLSEPGEIEKTAACLSEFWPRSGPEIMRTGADNLRRLFSAN
ncbi:TatD family hydrolase [bacterium]|nr:TatD family hydrolase [bacterium]